MKKSIDILIITNLPSFYKINLYNEIARSRKIFVVYTGDDVFTRNNDFIKGEMKFEYVFLTRSRVLRIFELIRILYSTSFRKLQVCGWDSLPLWIAAHFSARRKNGIVVESTYLESATNGIKGSIKRLFLKRISTVYASGVAQKKLTDRLGFKGKTILTRGVGIFNVIPQPAYKPREAVRDFLYVGRLSLEKNLPFLIDVFNGMPDKNLTIIGFGPLEQELRARAGKNIRFLGAIDNRELSKHYQAADVFVLPSLSEVWGLVVEEALNNGVPVIVSDRVGCAEEIISEGKNGLVFRSGDKQSLTNCIERICDTELYNAMRKEISRLDFEEIERRQVACYLD